MLVAPDVPAIEKPKAADLSPSPAGRRTYHAARDPDGLPARSAELEHEPEKRMRTGLDASNGSSRAGGLAGWRPTPTGGEVVTTSIEHSLLDRRTVRISGPTRSQQTRQPTAGFSATPC
jgi:hypothetical protein